MASLTTAERRGYQQICGEDGAMMVIACDQRGGMRTILAPPGGAGPKIGDDMLGDTKSDIVRYLAQPRLLRAARSDLRRAAVVDDGVLARDTALLIGLDASGYDTSPEGYRLSRLVPGDHRAPRARARRHRRQDHGLSALRRAGQPKTHNIDDPAAAASTTSPPRTFSSSSSS